MITFEKLIFRTTKIVGNTIATVKLDNGYQFDIIRKLTDRVYKVKGFEMEGKNKLYVYNYFEGFNSHPEFKSKEALIIFINEIELLEEEE